MPSARPRGRAGPVAILAGAGTGKTTTITTAHRLPGRERRVPGRAILAVTFTEKAAGELKDAPGRARRRGRRGAHVPRGGAVGSWPAVAAVHGARRSRRS